MTALEDTNATVSNRHVTALATEDALTLLYRIRIGACDESFGLHVAKLAKFPPRVVEVYIYYWDICRFFYGLFLLQFARQKAEELETWCAPLAKKPRRLWADKEEEGVEKFLEAVCSLPLAELGEDGAKTRLREMVTELSHSCSPEVKALIDSSN